MAMKPARRLVMRRMMCIVGRERRARLVVCVLVGMDRNTQCMGVMEEMMEKLLGWAVM